MKNILVTGGKGQLAACIKDGVKGISSLNFIYADKLQLDITNIDSVLIFFKINKISYCINCAAYTAVDNAESDNKASEIVNVLGARNLAVACGANDAILIHVSTDFVFDGSKTGLYSEDDRTNPLSVYGVTKLNGELAIKKELKEHIIIRTSWLYSEHGNNFLKTMLKLGSERDNLNVVADQIGTPTYAGDLAKAILSLLEKKELKFGTFHYSNEGVASWYDFAKAIFDISGLNVILSPIKSEAYPTPALRPSYSVMDKTKFKSTFLIEIPYWRDSLKKCLSRI